MHLTEGNSLLNINEFLNTVNFDLLGSMISLEIFPAGKNVRGSLKNITKKGGGLLYARAVFQERTIFPRHWM